MDRAAVSLRIVLLALVAAWALGAVPAGGQDRADSLRDKIDSQRGRERSLSGSVARLARLERATARQVAILQRRVAAVQSELAQADGILRSTIARREEQHKRALRLRARLADARAMLAARLRQHYAGARPDLVTVVLNADGFARLLETVDFLKRIQRQDERILALVRDARGDALAQRRTLARLAVKRREVAETVRRRRNALAAITAGLRERRAVLGRARAARSAALRNTRSGRQRAQRALTSLLAERARALRQVGPGGPWGIPWPIVQCESGGQNLPPNSAGASGFYQFLPQTWRGLGGSTPQAYLAPKAEQDRLAAQLWDGGRGAHNWVCAALVG